MSKQALDQILTELYGEINRQGKSTRNEAAKVFRERVVNRFVTEARVSKTELQKQVETQIRLSADFKDFREESGGLNPKIKAALPKIIDQAFDIIRSNVGKRGTTLIPGATANEFTIRADSTSSLNYDKIKDTTKPGTDFIRTELGKVLGIVLSDKTRLLELGHSDKAPVNEVALGRLISGRPGGTFAPLRRGGPLITQGAANPNTLTGTGFGKGADKNRQELRKGLEEALTLTAFESNVRQTKVDRILEIASRFDREGDKLFTINVELESQALNAGKSEDKNVIANYRKALLDYVKKKPDWASQGASDSKVRQVQKEIIKGALKIKGAKFSGDRTLLQPVDKKPSKSERKENVKTSSAKVSVKLQNKKKPTQKRVQQGGFARISSSIIGLVALLNERLPPQVRSNMVAPRLQNRTGRFSESAKVLGIIPTPRGFPSLLYSYQRNPYDVFDRRLGTLPWNTAGRDPRDLVELSIRQIAIGLNLGRFFLRRV